MLPKFIAHDISIYSRKVERLDANIFSLWYKQMLSGYSFCNISAMSHVTAKVSCDRAATSRKRRAANLANENKIAKEPGYFGYGG